MKRYVITVDEVYTTTYEVTAEDEEDALLLVQEGGNPDEPSNPVITSKEGQGAVEGAAWRVVELDEADNEVQAWEYTEACGWEEEEEEAHQ
jgi:hypothetical protein